MSNKRLKDLGFKALQVLRVLRFHSIDKKPTVTLIKRTFKDLEMTENCIHKLGINAFWRSRLRSSSGFQPSFLRLSHVVLFLFFLFLADGIHAQKYLSLRSQRKAERINYRVGDEINIRLDGEKTVFRGSIDEIRDSSIVFNRTEIHLSRVDELIDFSRGRGARAAGKSLWIAVPITFLFNGLNRWINTEESPVIDQPTIELAAVFAGTGTALMLVPHKRYKTRKNWRLVVIDTTFYP